MYNDSKMVSSEPNRQSDVSSEMTRLDNVAKALEESSNQLTQRLAEILSTRGTEHAPTLENVKDAENMVPLAGQIRNKRLTLEKALTTIHFILDRIEL